MPLPCSRLQHHKRLLGLLGGYSGRLEEHHNSIGLLEMRLVTKKLREERIIVAGLPHFACTSVVARPQPEPKKTRKSLQQRARNLEAPLRRWGCPQCPCCPGTRSPLLFWGLPVPELAVSLLRRAVERLVYALHRNTDMRFTQH